MRVQQLGNFYLVLTVAESRRKKLKQFGFKTHFIFKMIVKCPENRPDKMYRPGNCTR